MTQKFKLIKARVFYKGVYLPEVLPGFTIIEPDDDAEAYNDQVVLTFEYSYHLKLIENEIIEIITQDSSNDYHYFDDHKPGIKTAYKLNKFIPNFNNFIISDNTNFEDIMLKVSVIVLSETRVYKEY